MLRSCIGIVVLLAALACTGGTPERTGTAVATEQGFFLVTAKPGIDPLKINQIHEWRVHLTDKHGKPIDEAMIAVDGDMPEHQHGLPTQPELTRRLGDGDYLIEGVKFSMPGLWQLTFTIQYAGVTDSVTLELTL